MTDETDPFDRPRGLTSSDRAFIEADRSNISDNTRRQKWYRIRERVRSMILDFSLLLEHLPDDQLEQIFYPDDREERRGLNRSANAAMALFFYRQYLNPDAPKEVLENPGMSMARQNSLVRAGLEQMLERRGEDLYEYDYFGYSTAPPDLEDLWRRFRSGEALTHEQFETLQRQWSRRDLRDWVMVTHVGAFSQSVSVTEDDDVLIPGDRRYQWNRPLKEDEDDTPHWVDEESSNSTSSDGDDTESTDNPD